MKEAEIKRLLGKPQNADKLLIAQEDQKLLEQFYSNKHPELIFNTVKPLLTKNKYNKFRDVHRNHPGSIFSKVEQHFSRIYNSHGRITTFDFSGRDEVKALFLEQKKGLFSGISDEDFFKRESNKIALTQPNSVYIVGSVMGDSGKVSAKVKHIPLSNIHDVSADHAGIRYIIITFGKKDEERFFVYDDVNFSVWKRSVNGFIIDNEMVPGITPHNSKVCPAIFAYNEPKESQGHILQKSIVTPSVTDMEEYSILKTFYTHYKHFSAFGTQVKPATRCGHSDHENNYICEGGILNPIDPDIPYSFPANSNVCPNCSDKNTGLWGETHIIPIQQQGNEVIVSNLSKMHFRIEADKGILEFHKEDIESLRRTILNDIIGEGYGESFKSQAVNSDQIGSNLDSQEAKLDYFKAKVETVWEFLLQRTADIVDPLSDYRIEVKLGNKHFLKTIQQLYKELESLYKGTSNSAIIQQKQIEIMLTENRNDAMTMQRFDIVKALKPFSSFPLEYVSKNRGSLGVDQIRMFDNFDQVLAIFEHRFNKIESMVIDKENIATVIGNMKQKFESILIEVAGPIPDPVLEQPAQ